MKKTNNKIQKPLNIFKNNVLKANGDLTYVVSCHLLIESLLIEWLSLVLPKPQKLFGDYRPNFLQIIALCQAHNLFDDDIALVLKKVNTLRNRFSHNLLYKPNSQSVKEIFDALQKVKKPFYIAIVEPTERELGLALASLCGYIQLQVTDYKEM